MGATASPPPARSLCPGVACADAHFGRRLSVSPHGDPSGAPATGRKRSRNRAPLDQRRLLCADRRHDPGGVLHAVQLHRMDHRQCCDFLDRCGGSRSLRRSRRELSRAGIMMMPGSISNRIRTLRFMNGEMSQAELGQRIGLTRQTIAAIEAGKYSPSLEAAFRIAQVFNLPLEEVFQWDAKATPLKAS